MSAPATAVEVPEQREALPEDVLAGESPGEGSERGSLEIHPAVLRKLVQRIVDDCPDTVRTRGRLGGEHGATARITGDAREMDIAVELALRYPSPVREAVESLRTKLIDEMGRITGHRVRAVDVTVSALLPENRPAKVE
ncbi:Asp23/Gls24 family envelope stress response protein [Allokutzneria multivorans]|uniref:Asp23/Gls24 family envelope stress response protein n=1 Tax=Allokutzneria multivorans TaxID=1142134 RepID=A0ABP7U777_9PSEU